MSWLSGLKKVAAGLQNALEDAVIEGTEVYTKEQHERMKAARAELQEEWIRGDVEEEDDR